MSTSSVAWSDPQRQQAFEHWLAEQAPRHGLRPETLQLASADASFRRYLRIGDAQGGTRIVMDAPPQQENCEPFVRIAGLLGEAGLKVPEVLHWDRAQGFMLLSDLGRQTLLERLDSDRPDEAMPWFACATDSLLRLQQHARADGLPPYDEALLRRELQLFPDWYLQRHKGLVLDDAQRQTLDKTFELIVRHNLAAPRVFVHRDYMPRNLMVCDGNTVAEGVLANPGILDFQDAVRGPISYDVASMIRDAFISWDEEQELDWAIRYWQQARKVGLPVPADFGEFWKPLEWMGLQRHLKVLGIFCRLKHRDGKPAYSADLPRFFRYAHKVATRYEGLGPLARLLEPLMGATRVDAFY
jgi:hypothetical protein